MLGRGQTSPISVRASSLTLPVVLGLLFLGLQHLVLNYMVVVFVPRTSEPLLSAGFLELWLRSTEHGAGLPARFGYVNTLFVLYLWVVYRARERRWWARAGTLLLLGLSLLFLASQYALYRISDLPPAPYTIEVIRLQ